MDTNGINKINKEDEVKKCSAECCFDIEIQRYRNELIVNEVDDFVREVVEAVAYIVDRQNVSSRSKKYAADEIVEISDTDSTAENSGKNGNGTIRRHRKVTAKQSAEQEKRMKERRRIATERMKNREIALEEKRRKKEDRQKERERLKREEREARERKRKEDVERREQRKKEESERKEQRRIEEEIRKQKKEKEEEERRKKRVEEEERRERKKREEEAVQLKKKRESDRFLSFFDKKRKTERESEEAQTSSVLNVLPFFCKQGVSLAPLLRRKPLSKENQDSFLIEEQPIERPYLSTLKRRKREEVKLNRAKLFQFHDNWRPPYYGTWRKRSSVVTGRRPFSKDTEILDYDVDSDEEWEIPDGDDCDESTMSEEDEEDSDHSSTSDGFIVQHGYLSEGEGEDEQDRLEHHEDSARREQRLKAMADEWKHSLEQKSKKFNKPLVPLLWGPHFELPAKGVPEEVEQAVFFEYSDDDDDIENDYNDNDDRNGISKNSHDNIYIED